MNYFEEYFDLIEALPKEAQRAISSLHEADSQCAKSNRRLKDKIQHFLALGEDPANVGKKEEDLAFIRSSLLKGMAPSESRRQAAIRLELTVEKIMKKATARLEKIEEHFVDKNQEEQDEKDFVEQQQQQQAQNSLQQKNKKQSLQVKGKIVPSTAFAPGHVASVSASSAGAIPSPSSSALLPSTSSTSLNSFNPATPGPAGSTGANSSANAASGGQAGSLQAGANGSTPKVGGPTAATPEAQAGKKRKEQASASTVANAAKKPKTSQPYPREDLLMNLPVYSGRGPCPPLCGPNPAAPDYILKKGDAVAARTTKPKDPSPEWILATVVRYYAGRNRYEVEDVEEEEVSDGKGGYVARKKFVLSADAIIPLPKTLPDPNKKLEFAANRKVLALYPGTTCFYEAVVIAPPSKRRKENDYLVQFEDDEESDSPLKPIPQMFVLNMPQAPASE